MQINGLEFVTSQSARGHVSLALQFALDQSTDAAAAGKWVNGGGRR
jgi:multidrug efflux pump subunit AcrB